MDLQRNFRMGESNALDHTEPFYIVELGGGTGKLAFYILKSLEDMKDLIDFPFQNIVYVLTDFTESNINFWEQHQALKPFVESGRLDFAKFEAVNDTELHLKKSGKVLKIGEVKNPICIVANYLIDTLCNDVFQIEKGKVKVALVSVGVRESDSIKLDKDRKVDHNDPDIINNLQNEYKYREIDEHSYYSSSQSITVPKDAKHFSGILAWYKDNFKDSDGASFLIPTGFLKAVRNISDLSSGKAFIITGDKGNTNPNYFCGLTDPHIAIHGSFSLMVNFHAIILYIMSRGGYSLTGNQEESALQVNCFILNETHSVAKNNDYKSKFPMTTFLFEEAVNFSPNDFFVTQKFLNEESNPSLLPIISLLKLSNWDPDIFYKFRDEILNSLSSAGSKLRYDLACGIDKIWDHYYHLGNDENGKDILFELGRVCYGLLIFHKALMFYEQSLKYYGDHHITYHNSGLCHFSLLDFEEAKLKFQKALEINPQYEKSKDWFERVQRKLETSQQQSEIIEI